MPRTTVTGRIEIDECVPLDLDHPVDLLRREAHPDEGGRLDPSALYHFAVARTERVEADLIRLAVELEEQHEEFQRRAAGVDT